LGGQSISSIDPSSSSSNVARTNLVGGLVGQNSFSTISNSYSTGNVSVTAETGGGLVGESNAGEILNSYSVGTVSGLGIPQGGLIGNAIGSPVITSSFYDSQTSGQTDTGKGVAKTTSEMKSLSTFADWNFTSGTGVWEIRALDGGVMSYPLLIANSQFPTVMDTTDPTLVLRADATKGTD